MEEETKEVDNRIVDSVEFVPEKKVCEEPGSDLRYSLLKCSMPD